MGEGRWQYTQANFLAGVATPAAQLVKKIRNNYGLRIGQSTVVSKYMHTFHPTTPELVNVMKNMDAGQVFYQRKSKGEVYHLDIFHQSGLVDHRKIAGSIKKAIDAYNFHTLVRNISFNGNSKALINADFVDIQTGTGGGRITGGLNFGKKESLRRVHENHVHIAIMLPEKHIASLFYIVLAAEEVILEHHLELRCNEKVVVIDSGNDNAQSDLNPYTDYSDSFMQEKQMNPSSPSLTPQQFLQDAEELIDKFETIKDIQSTLSDLNQEGEQEGTKRLTQITGSENECLEYLSRKGIIEKKQGRIEMTEYGRQFKNYLEQHLPEVEAHLRQVFHANKSRMTQVGRSKSTPVTALSRIGNGRVENSRQLDHKGELAIAETVHAAAGRMVLEKKSILQITDSDLRQFTKKRNSKAEIAFLLDASASMIGQRIIAAKFLIRHLLLSTPDRIAVIVFQGNHAHVQVPLTRDYSMVEQKLMEIQAAGATPLALGLKICLQYLSENMTKKPLIMLLTDGMPTFTDNFRDPLADALVAAQEIKVKGYKFTCIGLKPHHDYLNSLAQTAGGNAYLLDELEKQSLVETAWTEYGNRCL